jgi:hypothetical protein
MDGEPLALEDGACRIVDEAEQARARVDVVAAAIRRRVATLQNRVHGLRVHALVFDV